jgi:hypothetical protein
MLLRDVGVALLLLFLLHMQLLRCYEELTYAYVCY